MPLLTCSMKDAHRYEVAQHPALVAHCLSVAVLKYVRKVLVRLLVVLIVRRQAPRVVPGDARKGKGTTGLAFASLLPLISEGGFCFCFFHQEGPRVLSNWVLCKKTWSVRMAEAC